MTSNDLITIDMSKSKRNIGWTVIKTKVKKLEFHFGDKDLVEIKQTKKMGHRLTYKYDNFGGDISFK